MIRATHATHSIHQYNKATHAQTIKKQCKKHISYYRQRFINRTTPKKDTFNQERPKPSSPCLGVLREALGKEGPRGTPCMSSERSRADHPKDWRGEGSQREVCPSKDGQTRNTNSTHAITDRELTNVRTAHLNIPFTGTAGQPRGANPSGDQTSKPTLRVAPRARISNRGLRSVNAIEIRRIQIIRKRREARHAHRRGTLNYKELTKTTPQATAQEHNTKETQHHDNTTQLKQGQLIKKHATKCKRSRK